MARRNEPTPAGPESTPVMPVTTPRALALTPVVEQGGPSKVVQRPPVLTLSEAGLEVDLAMLETEVVRALEKTTRENIRMREMLGSWLSLHGTACSCITCLGTREWLLRNP